MNFDSMMGPVKDSIENLSKWEDSKHLICLVYDLTGILQAINSATIYSDFFDFYFTYSSSLSELFFKFYTDKCLCIPILKLLQELCLNRKNRIIFSSHCNISSAPNGVILFKYIQSSIFHLLSRYSEITSSDLDTVYHYKVLSHAIKAYAHALTGNFANISLLKLYSDDSGQKTIESIFFYMLNIPIEEILSSIQKFYHFFYFVEYLTRDDFLIEYLFGLPSDMTRKLLRLLADGVQSYDSKLTLICYNIVYNIMRLLCTVKPKMTPAFLEFRNEQDEGLKLLLKVFLGLILQGECANITDISRTLLALINLQQAYFYIALSEICTSFQETKSNFIKSSLEECWKGMNFDWCQMQNVETQEKLEKNLYWEKAFKKRMERFVKLINSN